MRKPADETPASAERMPLSIQLFRFVATGGLSAIVDFGLLVAFMNLAGLGYTPAKSLSWVAGTVTAYAINSRWTFQAATTTRRFVAVVALYLLTFALQVGTFSLLAPWLNERFGLTVAQVVGFVVAQGIATTVNFVVQRTFIFTDA